MNKIKKFVSNILIFAMVLTSIITVNIGEINAATKGTADALVEHALKHNGQNYKLKGCEVFYGDWCMSFIAHCAYKTGATKALPYNPANQKKGTLSAAYYPDKLVNQYGATITFVNKTSYNHFKGNYKSGVQKRVIYNAKYVPKKGDIAIFGRESGGRVDFKYRQHVGLVYETSKAYNSALHTVEGNGGPEYYKYTKVKKYSNRSRKCLIGFVTPNYPGQSTQTYTVKYIANGGNGFMSDTVVTYGTNTRLRANQFTRNGYTFAGWTAQRDDGTWRYYNPKNTSQDRWCYEGQEPYGWKKYVYGNQVNVSKSYSKNKGVVYFYAQWEKAQVHTFYYDTNGGSTPPTSMDVADGERFSVTGRVPTKDGYTFEGWTIHRLADDKYYVVERGWFTNEEIDYEGYTKRIYTPGESYRLDKAWTTGYAGTSDYIFEAQWRENETYEPIETPEPPVTGPEVIGFVSEEEFEQRYAGNSNYEATPYYRYATRQKEYTESTSSNLDGWTLYNQVTVPGSSAWSKTKPASGAYETGYQYYCWGWEHNGDWTFYYDNDYNNAVAWIKKNYTVWNYNQFRYFWQVYSSKKGSSVKVSQTVNYRDNNGKTGTKAISDTKLWYEGVVYRQKASTKYQFWRWGGWSSWSSWSTEKQATNDTVKEELQYYIVKK